MAKAVALAINIYKSIKMLLVFERWKHMAKEMKMVLIICVAGIIFNCLDCAAFGVVNGRYGCKMIWLLPFCIILYFAGTRKKSS